MGAQEKEKASPNINLDKILIEEIGPFGRFQIMVVSFVAVAIIFASISGAEWVFTAGKLPIRCLIPECDGANPEFEPAWLGSAVPGSPGNYDECNRFNISEEIAPLPPNMCPADLFNREQTIPCDEYVYELTNTVVYDFGLECDEWRRSLIGTIRTVGQLLSMPIAGFISDRWGRRIAFCITTFNGAWIGLLRAFVNNFEWFIVLHVFEATFSSTFGTGYIIVSEFVGPKYRVIAGPLLSSFAAVGFALNGLLAWGIQDWRHRTMIIFIPQLMAIGYYWIMPESARWLISKGRYTDAETTLKRAAKVNRKELSEDTSQVLRNASVKEHSDVNNQITNEPSLLVQVLKSRVILLRCCVTSIWWFTTLLVYYGISINAVGLAGNQYLNYIYVSLIEIPGFFTAMLVLDRAGRKLTLFMGFLVCSACQFGFAFIPDDNEIVLLVLYLLGKYSISLVVTSIYMYTAELYPTKCRQSLFAFSSMMGRIGQIIAPLTPALMMYWAGIPSVLFGSMTLLSAVLMLTTPETLGIKLPDTIEDAENLGRKSFSKENNDHREITKL